MSHHHLLCCLALLITTAALPAHATTPQRDSAVVLMYHHVGDERYPSTNIRLAQFESHLEFLAQEGFQVWPLARIVAHLQARKMLPDKTVAITFDDAYKTVYSEAYPRLRARGWPFTVFIASDYIDKRFSNYMSWEQMREMQPHGASYGNHSRSHDHLIRYHEGESPRQWRQRIKDDLNHAQRRLQEELGETLKIFAYPYGEYDLELAQLVAGLGLVAFGQQSGPAGHYSDMRFLPRFPVNEAYGDLTNLKTKLLSLALPVTETAPLEPVTTERQPRLRLTIAPGSARLSQLACYASGQGEIDVKRLEGEPHRIEIRAKRPLPRGRSRYNCTAPSGEPGRYFWFSHPWLVR